MMIEDAQNRLLWRDKTCLAHTEAQHELDSVVMTVIMNNIITINNHLLLSS